MSPGHPGSGESPVSSHSSRIVIELKKHGQKQPEDPNAHEDATPERPAEQPFQSSVAHPRQVPSAKFTEEAIHEESSRSSEVRVAEAPAKEQTITAIIIVADVDADIGLDHTMPRQSSNVHEAAVEGNQILSQALELEDYELTDDLRTKNGNQGQQSPNTKLVEAKD